MRAVEDVVGLPHGSVRHHFGRRLGRVTALFDRLADRESEVAASGAAEAMEQWLGPGGNLTLARYELFLMAARDPALRAPLCEPESGLSLLQLKPRRGRASSQLG